MIYFAFVIVTLFVVALVFYQWQYFALFSPVYIQNRQGCSGCEEIDIYTPDGTKLEAMVFEPTNPQATLLFFLGRSDDAVALLPKLAPLYPECRLVAYNYRGYGKSKGEITEKALLEDAAYVGGVVLKNYDNVFFIGFSLGGALAAYAASQVSAKRLFLLGTFDSIDAIAKERFGEWLPNFLIRYHFPTKEFVSSVNTPVTLIGSKQDRLVSFSRVQALQKVLKSTDEFVLYEDLAHQELLWDERVVNLIHKRVCR